MQQRLRPAPRRAFLSVGVLLAGLGAAALPATAQMFDPDTFTLENGLEVVVIENHRVPVVYHMVWYKVGAADEPPGQSGIAHYLEHLMFKATETLPAGEFSRIVARHGGRDNAFTASDFTGYHQSISREHLGLVMELEADRMANLRLTEEDAIPELAVVLEERRQRVDNNPASVLHEQAQAALFQHHPYRIPIIGWEHEIRELTADHATAFYDLHYAPNNAVLVVAGAVTADEVRELAEIHYGPIPARDVPPRIRVQEPPPQAPRRVTLESPQVEQPNWSRRYLAPSYTAGESEHAHALQVLAEVLGGGTTSRLYRSLVIDQRIATGAGAFYSASALDLGSFGVSASPRPGLGDADGMAALERAVDAELAAILEDGVTAEEVEAAVFRARASAIYARDSLSSGAYSLGAALSSGRTVEDVEDWPNRIAAVTPEQVQAAARAVLVDRASVTAILLPQPAS